MRAETPIDDFARKETSLGKRPWNPPWVDVDTPDYLITLSAAGVALTAAIIPPINKRPSHGVLFDESARTNLRAESETGRYIARDVSDVLLSMLFTTPFFVDALMTAAWYRQRPEIGFSIAVIDAEAFAITAAIQGVTNTVASRERPYGRDCGTAIPGDLIDCVNSVRYRSFFSGHSSLAFTGATLICVHHLQLGMWGRGADITACATALAAAATTATLRVVGDVHYATDVLTGALIGSLVGTLVPSIHYALAGDQNGPRFGGLDITIVPTGPGLALVGTF